MKDFKALAERVHQSNSKWWTDLTTGLPITRNEKELRMLIISEIVEALEGERKNLQDDKLPHRKMAEVEMADTVIRILDYVGGFKIELQMGLYGTEPSEADLTLPENRAECLLKITSGVCLIDEQPAEFILPQVLWACEAYCINFGYDLWGAFEEKMEYNQTRKDHTHEARKAANGKKF